MKSIIGKCVTITNKESQYYKEWGIVKHFDGDLYHIAIANGTNSEPVFDRDEFTIKREPKT